MPTYPGIHPDFDQNSYPTAIKFAIWRIAEKFYVTKAFKSVQIGNSLYWAVLVRPTEEFSIYVNTDREIVVLFSQYKTFEIRTLEAYDEFYGLLESKRIDRSIRFIVSDDDSIEASIRHYLDQNPEYPIIIPITFEGLSGANVNPLLNAIRRNYLLRDLFGYQNPLREETFFFGRQGIVNTAIDLAKSGQNSSLFGLRKSGKTSAIYAIQRKAKGLSINVVLIDCQNPAVHARRFGGLLGHIVMEIRKALGLKRLDVDLGGDPVQISQNFTNHMNNILSSSKSSLLLIFDEVENITPATAASIHWTDSEESLYFWQIIRSYIQSDQKGRFSLCIVGTNPAILESPKLRGVANPMYLYAQKTFIPSLSFEETREMVTRLGYFMGLEFSDRIIMSLHEEFGGHPFFTRQICSKIHRLAPNARPHRVSEALVRSANIEYKSQIESYLSEIIDNLRANYPGEFDLLRLFVFGDNKSVDEYAQDAPELIDHLIGYGLLERVGNETELRFQAVKAVIVKMTSESTEDYWAEISKRRNQVEVDVRFTLYNWSKGVSSESWLECVRKSLSKARFEALSSVEPTILFSRKESPLYFTDLIGFLKGNDVLSYLGERRSPVVRAMDVVNKLRKDAHANLVTEDEMADVREAFNLLEAEFSPP